MKPFEFLKRMKPLGPIVCVANGCEKPAVFGHGEEAKFEEWLKANEGKNIYWQPNACEPRRMTKDEIVSGNLLHVDIDSTADGKPLANNQAAKDTLIEKLKADGATLCVDSGGGVQAYFELAERMERAAIEARNASLIRTYAPHDKGTHDISRLLRVPGTVNFPTSAKKIAAGRKPVMSRLVFDSGKVHNPANFTSADVGDSRPLKTDYKFGPVDISDVELPNNLPASLVALIKEMDGSELPETGDGSESSKAWRAILLMLRHRLKPETVKGICLSLNWSIGLYFHEWASNHNVDVEGEVERQISKAMAALKNYEAPVEWPEYEDTAVEEPAKNEAPRLKLEDVADMPDEDEEEPELVPDWAPASGLVEIFGPPKAGKSWFGLDLALHIATGLPWCGVPVQQVPVVYLIGEGKAEIRKRVRAWYKAKGLERKPGQIRFLYRAVKLRPDVVKQLAIDNPCVFNGARAVFVDTVNRYMAGDENSTNDMTAFVEMCDALRGPWCLFALHHTGRADERRPRGSNVLDAAVDAKISVTRNKKTGQTIVKVDESRSGATPKPMAFRIKPFEYAPGKVAGVLDMAEAVKVSDRAFEVLQHMHDYPNDKQNDIVTALPELNDNAVSRAIKELVNNHMLTPKTG